MNQDKKQKKVDVSVVLPCLNEEETVGICIGKILNAFEKKKIRGEVVVCDNGSTDSSVKMAEKAGARVVFEAKKGYGHAYLKGLSEAQGQKIIIGDSDNTYDFSEIGKFLPLLSQGYDLVIGSRIKGKILPGAMPWMHQHLGTPLLTLVLNLLFKTKISDTQSGMRAFSQKALKKMKLESSGMELASEMIIKAATADLKIGEVPIIYHPRRGKSKLSPFKDGWKHLRFMLLYSPAYLFLLPGFSALILGIALLILLLPGPFYLGKRMIDTHTMILGSLLSILGFQIVSTGVFAKVYALGQGFGKKDKFTDKLTRYFSLERGIYFGLFAFLLGLSFNLKIVHVWATHGFKDISEVRPAVFATTFMILGAQIIFSSFFLSLLQIPKNRDGKRNRD